MKKAATYAAMLYKVSQEKSGSDLGTFFSQFMKRLEEKKETKLLPTILSELEKKTERESQGKGTTLIVRDSDSVVAAKKALESFSEMFDTSEVTVKEDKNIVGGFIAKNNTNLLDRSFKKGLLEMYQRLKS